MTIINEKILIDAGLSAEQTKIYLYLLENGLVNAKVIATKTGIGRTLTYKVLGQLNAMGMVEKRESPGKVTLFFPTHPQKIKDLISNKKNEVSTALDGLNTVFASLTSNYNILLGKPSIQFYDGPEGLKIVYEDILDTGKDILVISSPIDEGRADVLHLIREQINKQVAQNIRTKAITPIEGQQIATPITEDEKFLISRKQVPAEQLHIPAQIIIYGEKVAITNFKESMLTVVIDSKYIRETFTKIFDYIWDKD